MIQTILEISTDRLNWSMIAVRSGVASYEAMLFQARDVLAYYVDYFPDARIYTRVTYSPTSSFPTGNHSGSTALTVRGNRTHGQLTPLTEKDIPAAIAEVERIINNKRG